MGRSAPRIIHRIGRTWFPLPPAPVQEFAGLTGELLSVLPLNADFVIHLG